MIEAEAKLQHEDRKELWRQTVRVGKEHRRGVRRRQPMTVDKKEEEEAAAWEGDITSRFAGWVGGKINRQ